MFYLYSSCEFFFVLFRFIDFILFHGVLELSKSLKLIHDLALYHSDISLDTSEKSALFDLKILWENFEQIGNEF